MKWLIRLIEFIAESVARLAMWLLVPMFLISLYEVVSRYFFNAPTTWAAPIISILFIAAVVPPGADLAARNGHVRMDAFYSRWPAGIQALSNLLAALLLICFSYVLVWKAGDMAIKSVLINERIWGIFRAPIYPKKIAFASGAALFFLEALALSSDLPRFGPP